MQTSDFDYHLPPERIAQTPIEPRDHSRLMVLHRETQSWEHRYFYDIEAFLRAGDLLIVNESKVFKARLMTQAGIEIFLLRPEPRGWQALAKPARKLRVGDVISFNDGKTAHILEKRTDGTLILDFHASPQDVFTWTEGIGSIPVPPYVGRTPDDESRYQTVYAKTIGSVAAPTAGFHFTPELIERLKTRGIRFAAVTLHVGIGTFRPMKTERIEDHVMHEEWVHVPQETIDAIQQTHAHGGRVIAVGTTSVRALESGIREGFTHVFITPGYRFKYVDGLITNFHLPQSTLLVLISAFAGREFILSAYQEAIKQAYRFYSFGDAMMIV